MSRKFYKNVVTITVITEDAPLDQMSLAAVEYEISEGDCVGGPLDIKSTAMGGKRTANMLYDFGSEPDFFHLDDNGKDVEYW
jgi:hypothetical protein